MARDGLGSGRWLNKVPNDDLHRVLYVRVTPASSIASIITSALNDTEILAIVQLPPLIRPPRT